MNRRPTALFTLTVVVGLLAAVGGGGTAGAAATKKLTYQISDARAYAYKASVAQPVVQYSPKCDPKTEKYKCTGYNHKRNCPPNVAFGPRRQPPDPQPPPNEDGISGSAGDEAGQSQSGTGVPQSSAVRLNRYFSDGSLGREGDVVSATGISTVQYVDLGTPPWNGNQDGYTETDAFTNQANYEERCFPSTQDAKAGDDYSHHFSHSYTAPETIDYSECFRCNLDPNLDKSFPGAGHGVTEVHMVQQGDVIRGVLSAELDDVSFDPFPLTIDELRSYAKFESDGTAEGLRWQVVSTAQGVHFAGQPITLPHGDSIELGTGDQAIAIGMAGPYVKTDKDGSTLTMIAPGMFVATSQQTAFFAGLEMTGNFGKAAPLTFPSPVTTPSVAPTTPSTNTGAPTPAGPTSNGGFPTTSQPPPSTPQQPLPPSAQQFALLSKGDPPWAPVTILALGFLGFLVVFLRWIQQFEWGRRLYETQPLRAFDWLYRAFLKT